MGSASSLAAAVVAARGGLLLSQLELAGRCGVSQTWISRLERGAAGPAAELAADPRLVAVLAALHLDFREEWRAEPVRQAPSRGVYEVLEAQFAEYSVGALVAYVRSVVAGGEEGMARHEARVRALLPAGEPATLQLSSPSPPGFSGSLIPPSFGGSWVRTDSPEDTAARLDRFLLEMWSTGAPVEELAPVGQVVALIGAVLAARPDRNLQDCLRALMASAAPTGAW